MILCDGNYGLGAYGMELVRNWEPERGLVTRARPGNHLVLYKSIVRTILEHGFVVLFGDHGLFRISRLWRGSKADLLV